MNRTQTQPGFTLIEVLITVVIFGVGVLGVAGLNLSGQKTNQKAYQNLLATWKAQELVEMIRANPANAASFLKSYTDVPSGASDCAANSCSSTAIASYDLQSWHGSLGDALPATTQGAVYSSGGDYVVYVIWDSRSDGQSCQISEHSGSPTLLLACVQMEFSL